MRGCVPNHTRNMYQYIHIYKCTDKNRSNLNFGPSVFHEQEEETCERDAAVYAPGKLAIYVHIVEGQHHESHHDDIKFLYLAKLSENACAFR